MVLISTSDTFCILWRERDLVDVQPRALPAV
jgi:hypothetical protein